MGTRETCRSAGLGEEGELGGGDVGLGCASLWGEEGYTWFIILKLFLCAEWIVEAGRVHVGDPRDSLEGRR